MSEPILVSACLLGLLTRYDGTSKRNAKVISYLDKNRLVPVPVCPEQLAGLPTPRPKTCFQRGTGDDVLDGDGIVINEQGDVANEFFLKGAMETIKIARIAGCRRALLKERSPSCGVHQIYLGDSLASGSGVTSALLKREGIITFSEDDL